VPDFPQPLERVLMRGLAKDPARRYPSIDDFVRALRAAAPATTAEQTQVTLEESDLALFAPPAAPAQVAAPGPAPPEPVAEPAAGAAVAPSAQAAPTPIPTTPGHAPVSDAAVPPAGSVVDAAPPPLPPAAPAAAPLPGEGGPGIGRLFAAILVLLLLGGGAIAAALAFTGGDDGDGDSNGGTGAAVTTSTAVPTATATIPGLAATSPPATTAPGTTATATSAVAMAAATRPREQPTATQPGATAAITATPAPPLGDVTGPAATVDLRNYLSVPATIVLEGAGSITLAPGQFLSRPMPAGTWSYVETAEGFAPLQGQVSWDEGGIYFWELYDPQQVEIVEIVNNLNVGMTLSFDRGYGDVYLDPGTSRTRAFPAGEYTYAFRADGYQESTATITFTGGKVSQWPWQPPE
jgi:hypothetical protein